MRRRSKLRRDQRCAWFCWVREAGARGWVRKARTMDSPLEGSPVEGLALESRHGGRHCGVAGFRGCLGCLDDGSLKSSRGSNGQASTLAQCRQNRGREAVCAWACKQLTTQQEARPSTGAHQLLPGVSRPTFLQSFPRSVGEGGGGRARPVAN